MSFTIVGTRFDKAGFAEYVKSVRPLEDFTPDRVIIHNASTPNLDQRKGGFTAQQMKNLRDYYAGLGWRGGPHIFADDIGIWVFNPLNVRGTHSPSYNSRSFGIEHLGEYSRGADEHRAGRGKAVWENGLFAAHVLAEWRGIPIDSAHILLHREDPATTHACPGDRIEKLWVLDGIRAARNSSRQVKVIVNGVLVDIGATLVENVVTASAEALHATLGVPSTLLPAGSRPAVAPIFKQLGYWITWDNAGKKLYLNNY